MLLFPYVQRSSDDGSLIKIRQFSETYITASVRLYVCIILFVCVAVCVGSIGAICNLLVIVLDM